MLNQAFIKQMLANNGLNIKGIRMNLIPIHLTYDKNFKTIKDVYTWDKNLLLNSMIKKELMLQNIMII